MKRIFLVPIALSLALAGFFGLLAGAQQAETTPVLGVEQVRNDLAKLDAGLLEATASETSKPTGGKLGELDTSDLASASLRTRDIYRHYLVKAENISHSLLEIRDRLQRNSNAEGETRLSLQQLGALAQHLSAQNTRLKGNFTHGEDQFRSYQLIQKAVENLEDAIYYWRTANKYRELYRETAIEKFEDDDVLKLKIRTAINAIGELEEIFQIRDALNSLE